MTPKLAAPFFSNVEPFECPAESGQAARLPRIAKFARHGVRRKLLMEAFEVSRTTAHQVLTKPAEEGERSYFTPRQGRAVSVLAGEKAQAAKQLRLRA